MPVNAHRNDCTKTAPKRLLAALEDAGSERELSRRLGVNILYISQFLRKGVEPTDQTEKGRETRAKLFLPKRKRKPRVPKPEEWQGQKRIRNKINRMKRETQKALKVSE